MKIKTKIILGSVLGTLLTVGVMGGLVTRTAEQLADQTLVDVEQKGLLAIGQAKKAQVEAYFATIRGQLSTYANSTMTVDAMNEFNSAFKSFGIDTSEGAERQIDTSETASGSLTSNASGRLDPEGTFTGLRDYYNGPFSERFKELNNGIDPDSQFRFDSLSLRAKTLQDLYIGQNPNPLGSKDELNAAEDDSLYTQYHKKYHPVVRNYLNEFGYYDIFLINTQGDVVYSVFKELDYATNLLTGPYAGSGLAEAFKASEGTEVKAGEVKTIDFESYYPSYDGAAAFFSSPVFDGDKKIGVLVMQAPVDKLNLLMISNWGWKEVGLGDSGETYIVGSDNLLRNDSRFLIEDKESYLKAIEVAGDPNFNRISAKNTSIGLQTADTPGTRAALEGKEGFDIFPDYRGINVFSAYTPLDIPGLNWVLMAEIDEEEALRPVAAMNSEITKNAGFIALGSLLLVGLGSFFLVRSISKPLSALGKTIDNVANGDLTARAKLKSNDELEDLANAFDGMLDERLSTMEEAAHQNKQLNASVVGLMNATSQLADRDLTIEVPVAEDVTGTVSDALNMMVEETSDVLVEISNISKQVEDSVNLVQTQTVNLKGAADSEKLIVQSTIDQLNKVSDSIQSIGGLVETVSNLATNVQNSSTTTANTVNKNIEGMGVIRETVSETEKRIKRLGERSEEIGNIVGIINTLSERTHVLALNASMQAASAGEAGKGFAVVADEVQRLSESSRESTLEISALVDSIQLETSEAISTMNSTIERVLEGAELAGEAGLQMTKTQSDATELAVAIERISAESASQTLANAEMMTQANTVMESTEKTSEALDQQSVQTTNLVAYAGKLRSEVGSFKLPMN